MNLLNDKDPVKMKNITINIPLQYNDVIQKLIKLKIIPNRSEAIRTALREFLGEELGFLEEMEDFQIEEIKSSQPNFPNQIN